MRTLAARAFELIAHLRSMFRWKYDRLLQSFIDRIADKLFNRTTSRASRTFGYKKMNEKERDDLRAQLRKVKDARRGKQLVFFGDGTFSCTQKGHASIPKKKLIKQLAVRGLTFLLCERYTSLRCPCGSHELKNGEKVDGIRVRVHKTDGGVCSVLQSIQDRDEIACINMLLAASSACQGTQWPTHLTRTN